MSKSGEGRFPDHLKDLFGTNLKGENTTIVGIDFTFSVDAISLATEIPNHGEYWFKGMNLDLEEYKPYLKSQYKGAHSHMFPFKYLLEKFAPLMKVVIKFFTCEGRFSILYQYHIRVLMHFIAVKSLNL